MLLKMQKRVGQYRQEYQIQTCFVVCIKAVILDYNFPE